GKENGFQKNLRSNIPRSCAQSTPNSNFFGSYLHNNQHNIDNANNSGKQDEDSNKVCHKVQSRKKDINLFKFLIEVKIANGFIVSRVYGVTGFNNIKNL